MANFDATKGGEAATSYADVDAADDYFELLYGADEWEQISDDDKEKLLATATRQIDGFTPTYDKLADTQALNFPMATSSDALGDGFDQVAQACIEQALFIFQTSDAVGEARAAAIQGVSQEGIGPVSKTVSGFNPYRTFHPNVLKLLAPYLELVPKLRRG